MVPWQTEGQDSSRPQLGSLDMNARQMDMRPREMAGTRRLLSQEKYKLIKERLGGGAGPVSSSSPSGGRLTGSSSSGEQFQHIRDIVPPPGHPFLAARPSMQSAPPHFPPPVSHQPTPFHLQPPPSHVQPPSHRPPPSLPLPPPSHSIPPHSHSLPPPSHSLPPSLSHPPEP